jgi:hypothetical protein
MIKPDNGAFTPEKAVTAAEAPSYGQTALDIILEDQKRVARARGVSGIHPGDRPDLQIGGELSALILASYIDETSYIDENGGNRVLRINCREQLVFDRELMEQLLTTVKPGKPARAKGTGWYHYGLKMNLVVGKQHEVQEEPEVEEELHTPVELDLIMRLSSDSKKVVLKIRAKKAGSDAKTEPLVKKRLVFKAFTVPDFKGSILERLRSNPG